MSSDFAWRAGVHAWVMSTSTFMCASTESPDFFVEAYQVLIVERIKVSKFRGKAQAGAMIESNIALFSGAAPEMKTQ